MNNFSDPSFLNTQDVEATSLYVLNSAFDSVKYPINLFELLNQWGIPIEYINKPKEYFLAKITLTNCPKIFINSIYSEDQIKSLHLIDKNAWHNLRFSIGHEIGHNFLKIHNNTQIRERMLIYNSALNKQRYIQITESQANKFAAALLMPVLPMKKYLNYGNKPLDMAQKISEIFDVSLTSAFLRLAKLSDNIVACIQIDILTGKIKKLEYSKSFQDIRQEYYPYKALFIAPHSDIPTKSASYKLLNSPESSVKGIKNVFPIERWFASYKGDTLLSEWPYIIGNKIITFIEVEQPKELWSLSL